MKKAGIPQFEYDTFKQAYDSDPRLQDLVQFDPKGVTVNKDSMDKIPQASRDDTSSVDKMAKRAVDL